MVILAIETSCDDTCIAVIKASGKKKPYFNILSNIVSSQVEVHRKWGGVYPTLAKREHQKNLPVVLEKALKKAKKPKIDLIAVTVGPGLEPCLWVGVNFAKELAQNWNLPIMPVNHIEAHILVNFSAQGGPASGWPAVCLVVSGGHTQLILMRDIGKYKILGETRDDAAGECFDKVARILGLGYPGGPIVAKMATKIKNQKSALRLRSGLMVSKAEPSKIKIKLPRPMINQKNYDFSFSGLKTAVLYNFKNQPPKIRKNKQYIQEICTEAQQAVVDVLIKKTIKAAKNYKAKTIILGGGVSANNELRKQFKEKIKKQLPNIQYLKPNIQFCTDNAAMVGMAGYYNLPRTTESHSCKSRTFKKVRDKPVVRGLLKKKTKKWQEIKADANLKIC